MAYLSLELVPISPYLSKSWKYIFLNVLGFVNGKVNREAVCTTHLTEHGMRDRFYGDQG